MMKSIQYLTRDSNGAANTWLVPELGLWILSTCDHSSST